MLSDAPDGGADPLNLRNREAPFSEHDESQRDQIRFCKKLICDAL
jgi:hypothetical protein